MEEISYTFLRSFLKIVKQYMVGGANLEGESSILKPLLFPKIRNNIL